MKDNFNLFGFKLNTRKFIITMLIAFAAVCFLIGVDILWFDVTEHLYGLLIGLAFILAVIISSELTSERGLYKDLPYDVVWFVFPLAIIGARIAYVANSPSEFANFGEMIAIWEGGLSIFGGIIGGALGVFIFAWIKKLNVLSMGDIIMPVLALGQAIGRWGNFANQEVYGFEITNPALQWFPFGVEINGTWHLATFFYESMLNLAAFFVLLYILRHTKKRGIVTFTYFAWYGVVRLILESLRVQQYILFIPGTQIQFSSLLSILFIVVGVVGVLFISFKDKIFKKGH